MRNNKDMLAINSSRETMGIQLSLQPHYHFDRLMNNLEEQGKLKSFIDEIRQANIATTYKRNNRVHCTQESSTTEWETLSTGDNNKGGKSQLTPSYNRTRKGNLSQ